MSHKKTKSQISAETLVYVLSLAVISLIFILGYNYMSSLNKTQEASSFVIFKNNLKNDVIKIKQDYGSARIKEYYLPESADKICFVDKGKNNPLLCSGCQKSTDYRIVADSAADNSTSNIFLVGESAIKSSFKVDYVKIGCCQFKCFKAKNGKLKIMLEGDGRYALVTQE